MKISRRRFGALSLAACAAACSTSPNPVLYTIAVRSGPTFPSHPQIVQLRDISLPGYLDRKEIVRSSDDYKLAVKSNDWWGESLGGLLNRVLVEELSQRLPGSNIYGERGAISADANAVVAINIQRLDLDPVGQLLLLAQVAVEFNRPRRSAARTFHIAKTPFTPNTDGQVAAISDALGELADGVAALLQS